MLKYWSLFSFFMKHVCMCISYELPMSQYSVSVVFSMLCSSCGIDVVLDLFYFVSGCHVMFWLVS